MSKKVPKQQFFHPETGKKMSPKAYEALQKRLADNKKKLAEKKAREEARSQKTQDRPKNTKALSSQVTKPTQTPLERYSNEAQRQLSNLGINQSLENIDILSQEIIALGDDKRRDLIKAIVSFALVQSSSNSQRTINESTIKKFAKDFARIYSEFIKYDQNSSNNINLEQINQTIGKSNSLSSTLKIEPSSLHSRLLAQLDFSSKSWYQLALADQEYRTFLAKPQTRQAMNGQFSSKANKENIRLMKNLLTKMLIHQVPRIDTKQLEEVGNSFKELELFADSDGGLSKFLVFHYRFFNKIEQNSSILNKSQLAKNLMEDLQNQITQHVQQLHGDDPFYSIVLDQLDELSEKPGELRDLNNQYPNFTQDYKAAIEFFQLNSQA